MFIPITNRIQGLHLEEDLGLVYRQARGSSRRELIRRKAVARVNGVRTAE
jgi:hypothetical protein